MLKRVLMGLLILVLALVALLAASIGLDALLGRGRVDSLTNTVIPNPNGPAVRAYVAHPTTPGPHPAVIMIHEFWGLKEEIIGKADALAQEGYVVVAPDMFRGGATGWLPRAIFQTSTTPAPQIQGDLDAVFAWLATQPDVRANRIGIMGFCFGGGQALRQSLRNNRLAATAVLYGSLVTDPAQLKALSGPVLGIFGGADRAPSPEQARAFEAALNQAGVPNKISIYDGQPHAFVQSIEQIRQGGVQGQAWSEVLAFFKQTLQGQGAQQREVVPTTVSLGLDWGYVLRLAYEHSLGGTHRH